MKTDPEQSNLIDKLFATQSVERAQKLMSSWSGVTFLSVVSFVEAALPVPILTDPFLVAAVLADRAKVIRLVIITTISSVLGGLAAYLTALFFRDLLFSYLPVDMMAFVNEFVLTNGEDVWILTLLGAVTPVPYTFASWAVGLIEGNPLIFIIGSLLGRGFRYVVVGWSVYKFGPLAISYARRYIGLTSILLLILIGLYIYIKWLWV